MFRRLANLWSNRRKLWYCDILNQHAWIIRTFADDDEWGNIIQCRHCNKRQVIWDITPYRRELPDDRA